MMLTNIFYEEVAAVKIIAVEDAVGMTLWQDMTQIIPKEKRGHVFAKAML